MSGNAVFYPNGTQLQRNEVKIDIPAYATIQNLQQNKDKILDKAKK